MAEITIQARLDQLDKVLSFLEEQLEQYGCTMKQQMQIAVAVEEIYVNIAHYAYPEKEGFVAIWIGVEEEPLQAVITFCDEGIPYNPLLRENPDITLSLEERGIGGLGIYLVRKTMDDVIYTFHEGKNMLTLKKKI